MKKLTVSLTRTETVLGWCYLIFQLLFLPILLVIGNQLLPQPFSDAEVNFIFFGFNFICVTLIFHRYLIESAKIALTRPFWCLQSAFLGFAAYWVLSYIVGFAITALFPDYTNLNDSSITEMTQGNFTLMGVGTVLLVPVTEEVLYRGLVFSKLYGRSRLLAYVVSALFFSAIHIVGYITMYEPLELVISLIQYLPAGICLAWAYARSDSIWTPILIHITVNQIGILSMR